MSTRRPTGTRRHVDKGSRPHREVSASARTNEPAPAIMGALDRIAVVASFVSRLPEARYLEIGCQRDETFARVPASLKVGVDPASGGTHRMTSDAYFAGEGLDAVFDVVFIDGDHRHPQVMRDVENALARLSSRGVLVMHDCLPPDRAHESPSLCGTAWRAFAKMRERHDVDCVTGDFDYGVGIARVASNPSPIVTGSTMDELTYDDFLRHRRDWMRPMTADAVSQLIREWTQVV